MSQPLLRAGARSAFGLRIATRPNQLRSFASSFLLYSAKPHPKPLSHSPSPLPPQRRAAPREFTSDLERVVKEYLSSDSTAARASPVAVYNAPDQRSFYFFSYSGSALFVSMAGIYASNTAALPVTTLLVRATSTVVVAGCMLLAWYWSSVARRLVKSIELLPIQPGTSTANALPQVRIRMRQPIAFWPSKTFTLPIENVRISHRFGSAHAPPSFRSSSSAETSQLKGNKFTRAIENVIEDHKLMTQPQYIPKVYINGKLYYLDPRGTFLDEGRAVDRIFKLES